MKIGFFACALAALPLLVSNNAAAQSGELWEINSQMNIPGMPAGMGAQTQRVCQGDDPERAAAQSKDRQSCTLKDKKQTATRLTVTMVCKEGTMTIDQQYNAARTEFKGTMKMASRDGDMVINTTGRKVGACSVQEAKREQDQKVAAIKKQVNDGKAASDAEMKKLSDQQIKDCNAGLESMDYTRLGLGFQCYKKEATRSCQQDAKTFPEAMKACTARAAELCKRYQTQEGFLKAKHKEMVSDMCGVSAASIKAAQCPRAAQGGSLAFLGAYCPAEAKPLAKEHCAGRDYTSKMGGKYAAFCMNYLANADFENEDREPATGQGPSPSRSKGAAAASGSQPATPPSGSDQVKQGINQGMDKLKGLFGR
jgi:hypothetical protein